MSGLDDPMTQVAAQTPPAPRAVVTDGLPQDGSRLPEDDRSIGQILSDLSQDLSTLMRQETALARAEIQQTVKRGSKGAGMLGGAGVAASMALLFVSLAVWWALGWGIGSPARPDLGWSGLIVALAGAVVAAILAAVGKSEMTKAPGVHETKETLTQIPDALKGDEEKNR